MVDHRYVGIPLVWNGALQLCRNTVWCGMVDYSYVRIVWCSMVDCSATTIYQNTNQESSIFTHPAPPPHPATSFFINYTVYILITLLSPPIYLCYVKYWCEFPVKNSTVLMDSTGGKIDSQTSKFYQKIHYCLQGKYVKCHSYQPPSLPTPPPFHPPPAQLSPVKCEVCANVWRRDGGSEGLTLSLIG